jgi:hypothetical protein
MARMTKAEKAVELKVEIFCNQATKGVTIPMMSIGKIWAAGKAAVLAGGSDEVVLAAIVNAVNAVKVA